MADVPRIGDEVVTELGTGVVSSVVNAVELVRGMKRAGVHTTLINAKIRAWRATYGDDWQERHYVVTARFATGIADVQASDVKTVVSKRNPVM